MTNKDKKYFIPVSGQWVEVSKEIYYEYYRPIWRTRNNAKYRNQCHCPKSVIWKCDGMCQGCEYYVAPDHLSLNSPLEQDNPGHRLENTVSKHEPSVEEIGGDTTKLDQALKMVN